MPRVHRLRSMRAGRASATAACLVLSFASALSLGAVSTVAHAAQQPAKTSKAPPRELELDIEQAAPTGGYTSFVNSGSAVLHVSVVTDDGGALLDARPRVDPASDRAVRYPRYDVDPAAPHAVIQIVDRRGADDLDPGLQSFRFGADFNLDTVSEDAGPGGRDNGDNLIQRGLFNQQAQYKIQLDHRIATCRVKGSLGAVAVSSPVQPVPGTWYRVLCSRQDNQLTIVVTRWDDGVPTSLRQSAIGPIGVVTPVSRTVPVSVGGKLARRGVINEASDQFNGRIDNVFIRIG